MGCRLTVLQNCCLETSDLHACLLQGGRVLVQLEADKGGMVKVSSSSTSPGQRLCPSAAFVPLLGEQMLFVFLWA